MPATCYRTQERNGITLKGILTETNPMISQFCTENPTNHLGSRAMKRQKNTHKRHLGVVFTQPNIQKQPEEAPSGS